MKLFLYASVLSLSLTTKKCDKASVSRNCYKGRLEVKGMCSNYTIKLLEGNLDTAKIMDHWRDDVTGKIYTNVFALGSPCSFPDSIKQGDEFYFVPASIPQTCMVCLAYYPKPQKSLSIKVLNKHCP